MDELLAAMMPRKGDWMQTYSGVKFFPLDPREEDVHFADIAHSLAMQCRFNGHCLDFYSVAEHSVLVSYLVEPEYAFEALMHDAAEAYLCDIPRPIKRFVPLYKEWEMAVETVIAKKFGLPYNGGWSDHVMLFDNRILVTEAHQIMSDPPERWGVMDYFEPADAEIRCLPPRQAKELFVNRFNELTTLRAA